MNRLVELAAKLTPAQLEEVEDFAEFLISRNRPATGPVPKYLDVDAIAGMFEGLAPEKSSVELVHEANEAVAAKYDKYLK